MKKKRGIKDVGRRCIKKNLLLCIYKFAIICNNVYIKNTTWTDKV